MKYTMIILLVFGMYMPTKAQLLIDRTGVASFFSEAPMEDIAAENKEAIGAIDIKKGTIAVSIPIKGFHFEKSLMEEHFNENYLESERYPNATFKGEIKNPSSLNFDENGMYEADVKGTLAIHGVEKPFETKVKFEVSPSKITASTLFNIAIEDFEIDVPKLVVMNIAEVVEVKTLFNFIKKDK